VTRGGWLFCIFDLLLYMYRARHLALCRWLYVQRLLLIRVIVVFIQPRRRMQQSSVWAVGLVLELNGSKMLLRDYSSLFKAQRDGLTRHVLIVSRSVSSLWWQMARHLRRRIGLHALRLFFFFSCCFLIRLSFLFNTKSDCRDLFHVFNLFGINHRSPFLFSSQLDNCK
jgi:hypothetical protein